MGHWASGCSKPISHPGNHLLIKETINGMVDHVDDDFDSNKEILNGDYGTILVV